MEIIKILIADDDKVWTDNISKSIYEHFLTKKINVLINICSKIKDAKLSTEKQKYDIFIIGDRIEKQYDGLDLLQYIKDKYGYNKQPELVIACSADIVFIINASEYTKYCFYKNSNIKVLFRLVERYIALISEETLKVTT